MPELDLNLLRVFDTLVELRSATRAADRLGITQSAVSHALGRLRRSLGDVLFVRGPDGLQPTARALEIAPGVRDGLDRLREAMAPALFDLATTERQFVIAAGTYFCTLLIPALAERARAEAPRISFRLVSSSDSLVAAFDLGAIDLALGAFTKAPGRLVVEPLFEEELVWIAATAHPIALDIVNPDSLSSYPRIAVSTGRSDSRGATLADSGLERQLIPSESITLLDPFAEGTSIVYNAETAIAMVARTDAVALVPRRSALGPVRDGMVAILRTPHPPARLALSMLWHRKQAHDAGLAWLRRTLASIA